MAEIVEPQVDNKLPSGLVLLYAMDSASRAAWSLFVPVLAVYVLALGGKILHLGELAAIFGIAYSVTGFVVSKRYLPNRYFIMVLSYGLLTAYSILLLLASSIAALYLVILLGGVASSLKAPAISKISFDHVHQDLYLKASAFYRILIAIVSALFGYFGAAIIHHSGNDQPHLSHDVTGFKYVFMLMTVFSVVSFIFSLFYWGRYKHHAAPSE